MPDASSSTPPATTRLLSRNEACLFAGTALPVLDRAIHDGAIATVKDSCQPGAPTLLRDTSVAILVVLENVKQAGIEMAPAWKQRLARDLEARLAGWGAAGSHPPGMEEVKVELTPTVVIQADAEALAALGRARDYVDERAEWIESNPEVFGGEPVIRGTRLTAAGVLARLDGGDTIDTLLEDYPELPRLTFETAAVYARTHPRRGRPAKPWRAARPA